MSCISNSKKRLLKHQARVVNQISNPNVRGLIVDHSMGSGKTLTAVTAVVCFLEKNPEGKVYVITPVSVKENFIKSAKDDYGVVFDKNVLVLSYQSFRNRIQADRGKLIECTDKDMIIIDEAHNLRSAYYKTGFAAKFGVKPPITVMATLKCTSKAKKILLLTGTPLYNKVEDMLNLVAMIRGDKEPLRYSYFEEIIRDEEKLKQFLKCAVSFYKAPKDPKHYPRLVRYKTRMTMPKEFYEQYRALEILIEKGKKTKKCVADDDDTKNVFECLLRQAINKITSCPKCSLVLDILQGRIVKNKRRKKPRLIPPDKVEPTIIYSFFRTKGIEVLQKTLTENGYKYKSITGSVKESERQRIVNQYNKGRVKILLLTKAASEGLDLKGTRKVIIFEPYWNFSMIDQVIARAVRYDSHVHLPKSKRLVEVYNLILSKPGKTHLTSSILFDRYLYYLELRGIPKNIINKYKSALSIRKFQKHQDGGRPSIDDIMIAISTEKKLVIDSFEKRWEKYSIENDKSC